MDPQYSDDIASRQALHHGCCSICSVEMEQSAIIETPSTTKRRKRRKVLVVLPLPHANDNNGEEQFTSKPTASYRLTPRHRRRFIENSMVIPILLLLGMSMFSISLGWSPPSHRSQDVHISLFRSSRPTTRIKHHSSSLQQYSMQLWASSNQQPSRQSSTSSSTIETTTNSNNASAEEDLPIINEVNQQITLLIDCLQSEKKSSDNSVSTKPINILKNILTLYTNYCTTSPYPSPQHRFKVSASIDRAFRLVTNEAFSTPPYNSLPWINLGMETLQLQLHSDQFFISRNLILNDDSSVFSNDKRTRLVRLQRPYDAIPKGTWHKALRALTSKDIVVPTSSLSSSSRSIKALSSTKGGGDQASAEWITPSNAAFRILQRLITGKGIRTFKKKKKIISSSSSQPQTTAMKKGGLDERDFNMVLHSYTLSISSSHTSSSTSTSSSSSNHNHKYMDAAHRVMALQERTPHAPPLSPISYSILLKAYGTMQDVKNIDKCLKHARCNGIVPDIVMINVVLDAYVNCGMLDRAQDVFHSITSQQEAREEYDEYDNGKVVNGAKDGIRYWPRIKPNSRTYNTLLKGMAYEGDIKSAMKLSQVIQNKNLWDDITTNTLVKVAVTCGEYILAEDILTNHPSTTKFARGSASAPVTDHPNVEAYTELLDGYAKNNQLENALRIMSLMSKRDVEPNVYTYTCMVGALARYNKIRQGRKMMTYAAETLPLLNSEGRTGGGDMMALTPTYNAFISGLLSSNNNIENNEAGVSPQQSSHSSNIVEVLSVLQEMQDLNIHPNVVTIALVVDGLGKCTPPRCAEARELVQHLEFTTRARQGGSASYYYNSQQAMGGQDNNDRGISLSNNKIATALISAYGKDNDVNSAVEAFTRIASPDVVALNALLDACCRCDMIKLAFVLFKKHASSVGGGDEKLQSQILIRPDVVTYTTLISACLQLKSRGATKRAISLYNEMKSKWWISPDTILIDTILTAMISGGPIGFEEEDVKFTLTVLRDGSHLEWEYGQYEKRKKAVRGILVGCSSEIWKNDEYAYGLVSEEQPEDVLFTKKGWNKIDSGFRLWGSGDDYDAMIRQQNVDDNSSVDEFLASKGWNDIDSGFRIV